MPQTPPGSPGTPGSITLARGFRAAGTTCGIKPSGKPDLALIVADAPCAAAAVFTKNRLPGAPVQVGREHLKSGQAQAILINSGCANDATGQQGLDNARASTRHTAAALSAAGTELSPELVIPSSTGVIGPQLLMDKITAGIDALVPKLARGPQADADAAEAILTTDLVPKPAHRPISLDGKTAHLGGIAKGSGMIAPNLATMLVFLTTDVAIAHDLLQRALRDAAQASFNRISVDQHTSPSDTVLVLASGQADTPAIESADSEHYRAFADALADLCHDLAYQIVKDGEGATKIFRVRVHSAKDEHEADLVGKAVVDSPLVKTAVHGGDPNWGRITTAAGYSGAEIDPETLSLAIGAGDAQPVRVFQAGTPETLDADAQQRLQHAMAQKEITFTLDLGRGDAAVQWFGCDLSRQYITINADYTT